MTDQLASFVSQHRSKDWNPPIDDRFRAFIDTPLSEFSHDEKYEFFDWIRKESGQTSVRLSIEIDHMAMYREAVNLRRWAVDHRGSSHDGWKSICLHGIDYHKTNDAVHAYGYADANDAPYQWTIASVAAPTTTRFFKNDFPFQSYQRLRFMYLEPGGYILPHRDSSKPGLSAMNIALNNPNGCEMVIKDKGIIPWKAGDVRFFDTHNEHAVWNNSNQLRIHMIAHSSNWGNRFRELVDFTIQGYLEQIDD